MVRSHRKCSVLGGDGTGEVGITLASVCTWTLFGHLLRDYVHTEHRRRVCNFGMASLLVLSIIPVLGE